jgi:hypothetical protein
MPGIYDDVGFDAYGAGRETRNQLNNAQAFGRGVKQVASGVAEVPGKTWDGMMAAGAPLLDRQFAAMEAQGRAVRGAGANFMRGFDGPADAPYAEDAPRTASPRAALPAPTQRPDDITGSAARIQAANPRGSQAVPQMARTLVQESQQRFAPQQGVEGSIGVDGYMRQLQNIRALSDMTPQGGYAVLGGEGPTWQERQNAEMTSKWAQEDRDRQFRGVLGGSGADARARMGAYTSYANAQNGADVQRQNALLGYQGGRERDQAQFGLESMRGSNQLAAEGMRGRNQLAAEGMRGGNQLAAERMRGENQFGIEDMRRAGRLEEISLQGENQRGLQEAKFTNEGNDPYKQQLGGYYGAQTRKIEDELAYGKTPSAIINKHLETLTKMGMDSKEAIPLALKLALGAQRAQAEQKANGGVVGYAEGGNVAPMSEAEALLARMDAKYGKTPSQPAAAPRPAPVPPPVQAQPEGWWGKTKAAIGGYGRPDPNRMPVEARAVGGGVGKQPGETDQAYLARMEKEGAAYTATQNYSGRGSGGTPGAGVPAGVPGTVSYEPGGVQRRSVGGIDQITDPNAPGGANYGPKDPTGLGASGGYGTYKGSGQSRGVTPWDQTPAGQPNVQQGESALYRSFGSGTWMPETQPFAFGGAVPPQDVPSGRAVAQAVAGRQVFGQSDGSGVDDALPAVIDGERPAALTSGEFVWPVKAVKYFGMSKLNKMLAEAEKGMAAQDEHA